MADVAEVADDIFRVNLPMAPDFDVSFFVIRDEAPTLVETGFRRASQRRTKPYVRSSTPPRCATS